ncbi:hypothetical protein TNCV_5018281 [Trichonephila clavipes]|nr:hypothetical protein TNCV_5018281 [Trichonephila clavipes]
MEAWKLLEKSISISIYDISEFLKKKQEVSCADYKLFAETEVIIFTNAVYYIPLRRRKYFILLIFNINGHGHGLVVSVVESLFRVLVSLKYRRVEGLLHVESVVEQSPHVGVEVKRFGVPGLVSSASLDRGLKPRGSSLIDLLLLLRCK